MMRSATARSPARRSPSRRTAARVPPASRQGWGRVLSASRRSSTGSGAVRKTTRTPSGGIRAATAAPWRASTTATAARGRGSAAHAARRSRLRLSTTSTPAASRAWAALALPAPLIPVRIHAPGDVGSAVIFQPSRRDCTDDYTSSLIRWATTSGTTSDELLDAREADGLDGAEAAEQGALAHRAQTGDDIETGAQRRLGPAGAVPGDGEAVGLVADPLDQEERGRIAGQDDRIGLVRPEQLLVALGQAEDGNVGQPRLHQHRVGGAELALPTVDEQQVGERREALLGLAPAAARGSRRRSGAGPPRRCSRRGRRPGCRRPPRPGRHGDGGRIGAGASPPSRRSRRRPPPS